MRQAAGCWRTLPPCTRGWALSTADKTAPRNSLYPLLAGIARGKYLSVAFSGGAEAKLGAALAFSTSSPQRGASSSPPRSRSFGLISWKEILTLNKRILSIILTAALSLALAAPVAASATESFDDVPLKHWAHEAIEAANADGIMTGTAPRQFDPDKELTVAEFATILSRAFYAKEVEASTISGEWYAKYMDIFSKHKLVGANTNSYTADRHVERIDMATIMRFVLLDKGIADPSDAELEQTRRKVVQPDLDLFQDDFIKGVLVCYHNGLLTGVDSEGTFDANGTVTRSQTATIYLRLRDFLKDNGVIISSPPVELQQPTPTSPVETPEPANSSGDTTFAFINGETTVQQMMNRINSATPAYREGYLTNSKPITNSNIQEMLAEIEESMPNGAEWNTDNKYLYLNP